MDDTDDPEESPYTYTRLGKLSTFTCVVLDDDIIPLNVEARVTNASTKMIFAIQPYRDGRQLRDSAGKASCMAWAGPWRPGDEVVGPWRSLRISGMEKKGVKRPRDSSSSSSSREITDLVESESEDEEVNEKFC